MRGNRLVMLALGAALAFAATSAMGSPVVDATKPGGIDMVQPPLASATEPGTVKPVLPSVNSAIKALQDGPAPVPQAKVSKLGVHGQMRPRWMNMLSPPLAPRPG